MLSPFGQTRTQFQSRHALISPDGHVASTLPGAAGVRAFVHISPVMGARFAMTTLFFDTPQSTLDCSDSGQRQAAGYLLKGEVQLQIEGKNHRLRAGDYFYLPPATRALWTGTDSPAHVVVFEKNYESCSKISPPSWIIASEASVAGQPFLGNPKALLQVLLPDTLGFDLALNIFTFQTGTALPFVETHIMEHGLLMLSGQGIYRLENSWYPVATGDVIWMASYCPQWFVAMGDEPASYLYYKDINRAPLSNL